MIEDLAVDTVQTLVDFLYGAFKPQLSFSQAEQLFIASDKYCIHHPYHACIRALKTHLHADPSLLLPLESLADRHSRSALKQVHQTFALLLSSVVPLPLTLLVLITCIVTMVITVVFFFVSYYNNCLCCLLTCQGLLLSPGLTKILPERFAMCRASSLL